ncbi:MAG: uncharacterized protein V7607_5433 [Solirubrobacteraceae bacterium]
MAVFRRAKRPKGTRLFFATDIHGSEDCFRKFLNARRFYGVDALVLGGDIVGKSLVPITRSQGGYAAQWNGQAHAKLDERGLAELRQDIRRAGDYPYIGEADAIAALRDPRQLDRVFREVVYRSVEDWVALADERLRGTGVKCFVAPGNDDFLEIDAALQDSESVLFAEARILALDDEHEMLTTGYSNPTPWKTERELAEPELRSLLDVMADQVRDMSNAVAVVHPPPIASGLDLAPKIDANFKVETSGGAQVLEPVGSRAVRDFLEDQQPLLALHGHVHEGKGTCQIGRTLCLNPGSEYVDGVLTGALIEIGDGQVISHQFVLG